MKEALKRETLARTGLLLWEWKLRLQRFPQALWHRWSERGEARHARDRLGTIPTAEVVTIIPTYKRGDALLEAIDSALRQTVTDHVVVVVDDGGGLPDTLPTDPRLFAFSLTRNYATVGVTRNVGIRATNSKYLAFLDDDNVWEPDHLAKALAAHHRGAQLTYSALRRVGPDDELVDVFSVPFDRKFAKGHAFVDASAIVVQRGRGVYFSRVPRRMGDFPREDWEFVYRLSRRLRTEHLEDQTVVYRVHEGSFYSAWGQAGE